MIILASILDYSCVMHTTKQTKSLLWFEQKQDSLKKLNYKKFDIKN